MSIDVVGDISGAERAAGLDPADAETLSTLIDELLRHRLRNSLKVEYYEGRHDPRPIGLDTIPDSVDVRESCDWPRKAVTSVAERSRLSGFVFDDGGEDPTLSAVVRDTDLIGCYNRHVSSELVHGCMFATVGVDAGGRCYVRFHTAETASAIWDDSAGRISSGIAVSKTEITPWSNGRPAAVRVNMHLPGRIVVVRRLDYSHWAAESLVTPLDRPAMEAFAYRPTGLKPFGESRISPAVMSIADDVTRTLQNMAVSAALYSSPQKYLLGLSQEQFDAFAGVGEDGEQDPASGARSRWLTYVTRVLMAERDEDGNSPSFGQLQAASPEPYIAVLRTYATLFSGATGVPLNSLGIVQDNPSSAEAIDAAREDICICAQDLNESNGRSLRNVALMAMAAAEGKSIDDLSDNQRTVSAKFLSPSNPSVISQATAAATVCQSAPWFAQTDEFLRMVGFDEATIQQLKAGRALASAQSLLASFAKPGAGTAEVA